ncbi:etoposide-induced protein 2.4 homolog [Teleopsis dalmanni]|uniref:etoposide-induced protein 2.4 homolog n=1 Tax=Teleopsis dalmanni TaxID=139649 RepID=UPI0018CE4259|nr:etoposide-induced protein 2.4 homolog [Teleopsis dalmanni]
MDTFKNICTGVFYGFWDSIKGISLLFSIDAEIHRHNAEKEMEKQLRLNQHKYIRRTPSPTPSSASAMFRQIKESEMTEFKLRDSSDERSLESIRKPSTTSIEKTPKGEMKVTKQILKCCALNGGFTWLSIIIFEQFLLPTIKLVLTLCYGDNSQELHTVWAWLQPILSIIFGMMWVLPIFLLSKLVSSLWFADIANAAYRVRKGRPQMIPNISKLVADFLFSLVVQALFLVQSMLINLLPLRYLGTMLCFVHLCLLYSLYSFEYKWFNMGWELHRRLSYIENNWPYFIGFGIPLTILTNLSTSVIVSSCIFSIFFPLFILSGNEAKPLIGTTDVPMRLFSPVIFVSNLFFRNSDNRARKKLPNKHQRSN